MSKYKILLNILDKIRGETTLLHTAKYNPSPNDIEKVNHARSRAFIHLYFKVSFGILDFNEREYYITDGSNDGGIDGYYINTDNKTIYFIQSKFRTTNSNFESKRIELEEILLMDINRILEGETTDENGKEYNGKINQLIRDVKKVDDIARYKYHVVLLANLKGIAPTKLRYLTGGYPAEIFDYKKCYSHLVFPVISGTYFNASDLNIFIDLSNKNAGSKISYQVQTKNNLCEITVLFVPTIELAKILYKYKNSILKYNPRSYLDFEGQKVNNAIRETIINTTTNEFALFNNGITMLSDETFINEKIGMKNKAQLTVKNPQIINGGQTSFTLSRIYEENLASNVEKIFENKEVLLKIITLIDNETEAKSDLLKMELIDEISTATNQQTPVINADRISNEYVHVELQKVLFDRYGILYERKRGEFGDGIHNKYIIENDIIERNLFFRLYYAANGSINKAIEKKLFLKQDFSDDTVQDSEKLDNFYFGYLFFKKIYKSKDPIAKIEKNIYGQIFAMKILYQPDQIINYESAIDSNLEDFNIRWAEFVKKVSLVNTAYVSLYIDNQTQKTVAVFSESNWYKSNLFERDVANYFQKGGKVEDAPNDFREKLEVKREKQLLTNNTKDEIVQNIEKNKQTLNSIELSLQKLEVRKQDLINKLNSLTDGLKFKRKVVVWFNENDKQIKRALYSIEMYKKWIEEDNQKLSEIISSNFL